jgi:hypothetical protein
MGTYTDMESLTNDTATAFQSPVADGQLKVAGTTSFVASVLSRYLQQLNGWTIALTLILLAITYDQGMPRVRPDEIPRTSS